MSEIRFKPGRAPERLWIPPAPESSLLEDQRLLGGPRSRTAEFLRVMRIVWEFIRGFQKLHWLGPCVTVFGSARFDEPHPYYQLARKAGAAIAREGFTIITGGGPGIMEAANRGAKDVRGRSVGCNIVLAHEQHANPYIDKLVTFRYFFVRKVMLVKYSQAFLIFPGGFGTLDEAFEAATLIQTGKISNFPLIFVGREYWQPLFDFLQNRLLYDHAIDQLDYDRLVLTDSVDEILQHLNCCPSEPQQKEDGRVISRKWQPQP